MVGIIGAMEEEVAIIRGWMEGAVTEKAAEFAFISGKVDGKDIVLLQCGIGKVNSAVGCAIMIDRYHPECVINTGSAGGVDPALVFGDTVIGTDLVQWDVDVRGFGYALGQVPKLPPVFKADPRLVAAAEEAVKELHAEGVFPAGFNISRGLIASGDVFMHEADKIQYVKDSFPGVQAVEMEGAAIAQTAFVLGTPFLIIRALSDIAGKESPMKFDEFLPVAAKHTSLIVRRMLGKI
jgi:adenosylhomocysteine nucleosidase